MELDGFFVLFYIPTTLCMWEWKDEATKEPKHKEEYGFIEK